MAPSLELNISRVIKAPPARVFAAWTQPDLLMQWWGPGHVSCPEAHVDLRPGGKYRIANLESDGNIIWISGVFTLVSEPEKLVYEWHVAAAKGAVTLVTVLFNEHPAGTELVLTHERFPDAALRDMHRMGWDGCFVGLEELFGG